MFKVDNKRYQNDAIGYEHVSAGWDTTSYCFSFNKKIFRFSALYTWFMHLNGLFIKLASHIFVYLFRKTAVFNVNDTMIFIALAGTHVK